MRRARGIFIILLLNIAAVAAPFLTFELLLRAKLACPFTKGAFPTRFVAGVGEFYRPGAQIRDTNRVDYCAEQTANSLGFLDREPLPWAEAKDRLRIAIIGDSVVEASQVAVADKMQSRLTTDLKTALGVDAAVSAFGISALGQVQELALFERYAVPLHPQLVVLVVVRNDLKNNSWLLQAIEDKLSPATPSYPAIRPQPPIDAGGNVRGWIDIPPVPDEAAVELPMTPPPSGLKWLHDHSALYAYLAPEANAYLKGPFRAVFGSQRDRMLTEALAQLRRDPELAPLLADWPRRADGEHVEADEVFETDRQPPAFALAVRASEYAMDRWTALARRDGFRIVALLLDHFRSLPRQAAIWSAIMNARGIPLIVQAGFLDRKGYDHDDAHFRRDPHLSAKGHRWVAESLTEFLGTRPDLIGSAAGPGR